MSVLHGELTQWGKLKQVFSHTTLYEMHLWLVIFLIFINELGANLGIVIRVETFLFFLKRTGEIIYFFLLILLFIFMQGGVLPQRKSLER